MIDYTINLDITDVSRKLRKMGLVVSEVNGRALGDVAEAIVSHSQKNYFRANDGQVRNDQRGPGSLRTIRGARGLRGRISYEVDNGFQARVGVLKAGEGFNYAAKHEYGLGVPKRPYVAPAIDDYFETGLASKVMQKRFDRELQEAFDRA